MIVLSRTRTDLERELVVAERTDPELADTIRAALETTDFSRAWTDAEQALSFRRPS